MNLQPEIQAELDKAREARNEGNEGQARVCARRAAGVAARQYFSRRGRLVRSPSAYDLLGLIASDPMIPAGLREKAARLTLRVDEEFRLPPGLDLIDEATELSTGLAELPSD